MLASWVSVAEAKDDVVEDMDTSEPNWAWFYLAECGRWHIFGVSLTSSACMCVCVCPVSPPNACVWCCVIIKQTLTLTLTLT